MKILSLFFILMLIILASCTDENGSRRALEAHGFNDIRFTGYSFFTCSDSDDFSTGFLAKNSQGKEVSGVVCCGITKGCTVRF